MALLPLGRSRTSRICTSSRASAAPRAASARRARSARFSWRQLVIPPCRKPPSLRSPTDSASRAARRPSSSSRPTNTISRSGSPSQASLEPKPAVSIGLQTAPAMWASSNCWSVRTSTSSAPAARFVLDLARRQRQHLDAVGQQLAAVERDDRLEVRRLRAEAGERVLDERVLVVDRQRRVVGALVADRRGDLHVHPRAAAHRAAEVAGPDLALRRQREQLVAQRAEDPARALGLLDREVGARDVVDEQRVAGQDRPRPLAARGVDERERRVLGPVAGRVQRAHDAARRARAPSRRRTARARSRARRARWMWIVAPVAAASRPWPETWSAWLWVSSTCSMLTPM